MMQIRSKAIELQRKIFISRIRRQFSSSYSTCHQLTGFHTNGFEREFLQVPTLNRRASNGGFITSNGIKNWQKQCFSTESRSLHINQRKHNNNIDQGKEHKRLMKESQSFLEKYDNISSIAKKTSGISSLVFDWSLFWGTQSQSASQQRSKHELRELSNNSSSSLITLESILMVDKLVHHLLDETEIILSQQKPIESRIQEPLDIGVGAWTKAPPNKMNGYKAQALLERMERIYGKLDKSKTKSIIPSTVTYCAVISAWADTIDHNSKKRLNYSDKENSEIVNGAIMASKILDKMEKVYMNGDNIKAKPNLQSYNTCLHGFAKRGMVNETERMLKNLESLNDEELIPDVYSYSICLNAYANRYKVAKGKYNIDNGRVNGRVEELLMNMIRKYEQTGDRRFLPNQFTFGTALSIMGKSRTEDGVMKADRMLFKQIDMYQNEKLKKDSFAHELEPTVEHFRTVALCYTLCPNKKLACKRIGELMIEMEKLSESGMDKVKPTYKFFIMYIDTLIKSRESNVEEKARQALSRIEDLCLNSDEDTMNINNYAYNLLMNAIARSHNKGRATRAQAVIENMNELYLKTHNDSLRPDKVSYTALMKALIADRQPGIAAQSISIFDLMMEESNKGNVNMKPDHYTVGTALNAISIGGNPEECEEFLNRIEKIVAEGNYDEMYPSTVCYNTVIQSYGKSRRYDSADQARRIFDSIETVRNDGTANEKNIMSYILCIDAYARSSNDDKVDKAEALVTELLERYQRTKNEKYRPSVGFWCALLLVYAESNRDDMAESSLKIIDRMQEYSNRPNTSAYNLVLKSCAKTKPRNPQTKKRVLEISQIALGALKNETHLHVDVYSYSSLLYICMKFIDNDEEKVATIKALFKSCCEDGMVNASVIQALKKVTRRGNLAVELLGEKLGTIKHVKTSDIPPKWTQNSRRRSDKF